MKMKRLHKRAAVSVALLACLSFAGSVYGQQDNREEKIRLMVAAVQARDSGDLQASKKSLEELLKMTPNDEGVQRMLADVNSDIAKQSKVAEVKAQEEAQAKAKAEVKAKEEAPVVEALDPAVAEAMRKQELQVQAAEVLVKEAYVAMSDDDWSLAAEKLAFAQEKLPEEGYLPEADKVRAKVNKALALLAKERAELAMDEKNLDQARDYAAQYQAIEVNPEKGKAFVEKVDKFAKNPYNDNIKNVAPNYAARQEKVAELMRKGQVMYLHGDYLGARSIFRQIETLDPTNIEAKSYQSLISEKLEPTEQMTYLATREAMLDEVSGAWQRPQVYVGTEDSGDTSGVSSVIETKLRDIIIPELNFSGVPLKAVVSTLMKESNMKSKEGPQVVIVPIGCDDIPVELHLPSLPLGKVLTTMMKKIGCQFDIEDDQIMIRKADNSAAGMMETMDFPFPEAAKIRMIGTSAISGGGGGSDPFGGGGDSGGDSDNNEEGIKTFLSKAGVEFGTGASLAYDGTKLWVTNSRRNLEKVRAILLRYNEVKQVEIESRFMEVQQGVLKELGFNWSVSNGTNTLFSTFNGDRNSTSLTYNNRTLSQSATSASAGGSPITITTTGSSTPETYDQSVPSLPASINLADGAASIANTVLGTLKGYDVELIVNALEQDQGTDLLCSPKVTVVSGSTATITVSQKMRYPESWGDVQSNVGTSGSSDEGSAAGVTITPGTPQDFTETDVGVVFEVTPSVEEDGTINLQMAPRVVEFEGFMEYGGVAVAISGNTTVTVPSGFIQPVFAVREVRTTVTVYDGATVVIGGLTREEVRSVDDGVPILQDIPWVGRLFQSKGKSSQKRNLLIFVTANSISPGGSVGREQFGEMRIGSVFQNPTVISPGGAVQRVREGSNQSND